MLDASAIVGPVPLVISIMGVAAFAVLLAHRRRRWWTTVVPLLVGGAVTVAAGVGWIVNGWWRPFPDPLPPRVLTWGAVAFLALGLSVTTWSTAGRRARALAVPLLVPALLLPAMKINAFYGYYPTVRAALGIADADAVDLAELPVVPAVPAGGGQPLSQTWQPPPDQPPAGRVARVDIPGTVSGFRSRPASVYLPPAYLSAQRRPLLPVLVLIAGQPGSPQDWLVAGKLTEVMNRFAAVHRGLAPVVVLPD